MPVLQLRQHIRQYTEQLLICHILCNSRPITLMNFIPVYIFIIEKTISFVHNRPQSLKITFRIICKIRFGNTRRSILQTLPRKNTLEEKYSAISRHSRIYLKSIRPLTIIVYHINKMQKSKKLPTSLFYADYVLQTPLRFRQ